MKKKILTSVGLSCIAAMTAVGVCAANSSSPKAKEDNAIQIKTENDVKEQSNIHKLQNFSSPFASMRAQMEQMQRQMDSIFGDPIFNPGMVAPRSNFTNRIITTYSVPKVKFKEEDDKFLLKVITPGMDKKDLSIKIRGDIITISGKQNQEKQQKEGQKVVSSEQITSAFTQSYTLPENIDIDKITSNYKNGVLTIVIPKNMEVKKEEVKDIEIQ